MSQAQERLPKGMYRPNDTVCGQSFRKRVVVCLQLNVVSRAIVHFHVTYDRGPMPRFISEGKRRDGIECGKDVPLARNQCPTKGRIKVIFCRDTPGEKLFRLTIAGFAEESLGEGGFDFARICNRVVFIEANDPAEVLNARHIVIGDQRLDHVFPFRLASIPYPFECRRTQLDTELAVSADEALRGRHAIDELLVVICKPESRCGGNSKPGSPAHRKRHVRGKF